MHICISKIININEYNEYKLYYYLNIWYAVGYFLRVFRYALEVRASYGKLILLRFTFLNFTSTFRHS